MPSGGDSKQTASSSSLDWRICGVGEGLLWGVPGVPGTRAGGEGTQAVRSLMSGVRGKENRELGDRARLAWMEKESQYSRYSIVIQRELTVRIFWKLKLLTSIDRS